MREGGDTSNPYFQFFDVTQTPMEVGVHKCFMIDREKAAIRKVVRWAT